MISRLNVVLVHQAAIVRTSPLDLPKHLLRISEEAVAWLIYVDRYNGDWTVLAIENKGRGLEIAVSTVEIASKTGGVDLCKNDIRLKPIKDGSQFRSVGASILGVDSSDH